MEKKMSNQDLLISRHILVWIVLLIVLLFAISGCQYFPIYDQKLHMLKKSESGTKGDRSEVYARIHTLLLQQGYKCLSCKEYKNERRYTKQIDGNKILEVEFNSDAITKSLFFQFSTDSKNRSSIAQIDSLRNFIRDLLMVDYIEVKESEKVRSDESHMIEIIYAPCPDRARCDKSMYHEAQYRKLIKLSGSNLPDSAMLKHVMTSTNRCINRQCTVRFSCELYQLGYIVNSDEKRNYQVNLCKSNAPSKRNLVAIYTVNQNTKIFTLMQYMNAVVTSIRGEFHGANVATK